MGRWLTVALIAAVAGCSEKASVGDPCGGDSFWIPGGAGQPDPTNGHTRSYGNGHSLNWLETDQAVIDTEIALMDLINAHRAGLGLDALQFDQSLARCARGHSRHHFEDGFFEGHVNPEGHSFTERMVMNNIDVESSGENVAYNVLLPQDVFLQWMANSADRENIERMCFVRIGIGMHQNVWTANFAR